MPTENPPVPQESGAPSIDDRRLKEVFQYWRDITGNRVLPRRADLDPAAIPRLLPHVILVEVHGADSPRYRYRLIGTDNVRERGFIDAPPYREIVHLPL